MVFGGCGVWRWETRSSPGATLGFDLNHHSRKKRSVVVSWFWECASAGFRGLGGGGPWRGGGAANGKCLRHWGCKKLDQILREGFAEFGYSWALRKGSGGQLCTGQELDANGGKKEETRYSGIHGVAEVARAEGSRTDCWGWVGKNLWQMGAGKPRGGGT